MKNLRDKASHDRKSQIIKSRNVLKVLALGMIAATFSLALAGCGASAQSGTSTASSADKTIKVGASPSPHAQILEQAKDALAQQGYTLEVVEYSDYVQPNQALADGSLDANYFQHAPYLENYNQENKTDLVSAGAVHFEAMGIYAGKSSSLSTITTGAKIAVPSDATNEARALLLLQAQGIIKLKDGAGLEATTNDIAENPHNVQIVESEAASLPRLLEDTDFAVINGNYALSAGLSSDKALATESVNSEAAQTYANIVAVRASDKDSAKTQALLKALQSDTVRSYINAQYNGLVVPVF